MDSVRSGRRFASWLALFALALQLVLSFGHVHLDGAGLTAVASATKHAPASPSSPSHPADDDDDYCAICAVMHLTSTTFLPQAAPLPAVFVWQPVEHSDRVATDFAAPHRAVFQSRGPPQA